MLMPKLFRKFGLLFVFVCLTTNIAHALPIDLSTWVVEDYPLAGGGGPASWSIGGPGNTEALQSQNSGPSILRSNGAIDVFNKRIEGTWRVDTNLDDDLMGFVFGYQNRGQMYEFGWKKAFQNPFDAGMYIRRIDTGNALIDPDAFDFATTTGTANTSVLRGNNIPWVSFTDYDFSLTFVTGAFQVIVSQGGTVLEDWSVADSTFTGGDFGFFNQSQPNVRYSGLTVDNAKIVPEPSTFGLIALGLLVLAFSRRKKTKLSSTTNEY